MPLNLDRLSKHRNKQKHFIPFSFFHHFETFHLQLAFLKKMDNSLCKLKDSKFRKQMFLFSFEPKNGRNYFLISDLASKNGSYQKNQGTLLN